LAWSQETLRIFGLSGDEIASIERWTDTIHPSERDGVRAMLERTLSDPETSDWQVQHRAVLTDGSVIWVEGRGKVLRDAAGNATAIIGIVQDVTQRKELEAQLVQSQRLETVGRLVGGVAHDFNNLLTAIIGGISLARDGAPASLQSDLKIALDAAERAATLTQRLLAFSQQTAAELRLLDLNELVLHSQKMMSRVLRDDVRLRTELGSGKLLVLADSAQLEQVLVNLAINGAEAMNVAGTLLIATRSQRIQAGHEKLAPGRYCVLSVSDSGTGMSEEQRGRVFEPFYTTKPRGVGLGLSTSLTIVERFAGTIRVGSVLGAGTTVEVFLPEAKPPRKLTPARLASVGGVLVVEDDRAVRETTQRLLVRAGFKVQAAEDLAGALRALEREPAIDIVVTDVIMPEQSGPELVKRLRELRPELAVLYVSGYAGEALQAQHGLSSDDAFLQKPYTAEVLVARIYELFARR
jgi:PAS domain S-box-containing protein